jgi:ABC-type transporter lipoprotein component MlaA
MTWKLQLAGFLVIVASELSACATTKNPMEGQSGTLIAPDGSAAPQSPDEQVLSEERSDPLEPFNQAMLTFNRKADDWVLHPVAAKWADVMPQPVRASVGRFSKNVGVIRALRMTCFNSSSRRQAQKSHASESILPWVSLDCSIPLTIGLVSRRKTMISA